MSIETFTRPPDSSSDFIPDDWASGLEIPLVKETPPFNYDAGEILAAAAEHRAERAKRALELGAEATQIFFHGTNAILELGDEIHPGVDGVRDSDGVLQASATQFENEAWGYADSRTAEHGGRATVYDVVPSDSESDSKQQARKLGPQPGEVNSPKFTVVGKRDVKPGKQGTFPEINWSKYSDYDGANHPEQPQWQPEYVEPATSLASPNDTPFPELNQYAEEEYKKHEESVF